MSQPRLIVLILSTLLTAIALPTAAHAGGYDVYACNASVGGGANKSFAPVADPGMAAYSDCPAGQGIVARNVYDNGTSGFLQNAEEIFDTPPGTAIASIAFDAAIRRHDCSFTTAVIAGNQDLNGNVLFGYSGGSECTSPLRVADDTSFFSQRFSYATGNVARVRVESRCGAATCPRNGVSEMRLRNVDVRVEDDVPPVLANGRGALWTSTGWLSGTQAVGFDATDGSGISSMAVLVDGQAVGYSANACDFTLRAPCPQGTFDKPLPTSSFGADGDHSITLQAVDTAGNPSQTSRTVHIDNSAPAAPTNLIVVGGDAWRSSNSFDVTWSVPVATVGAPVVGAAWDICPAAGGACQHGTRTANGVTSVAGLRVPSAGAYTLKLWLIDAAGNQDSRLAAPPVNLRFDDASPNLSFDPISADDPTLMSVTTSDQGSGVVGGQIAIRRQGATAWTPLSTTLAAGKLTARLDDGRLPDGVYELQATAADAAGNQRTTTMRSDGGTATVTLPVRLKTRLSAGVLLRSAHGSRLAHTAVVHFGRLVRVHGRLVSPEGNPLQNVAVQAYSAVVDQNTPAHLIATVRTDRTGRFSFRVLRGPSRTVTVRYGGGPHIQEASRVISLNVRSETTIRPNRRRLVNGETVRFDGRILTGRIPAPGKIVELQVWVRGRWRTFATTRAESKGRWGYDYRFDGTRGLQTYRFRAEIPQESGYPFIAGLSKVVRVHVRGV